jgi:hypothetical protein
MTTSTTPEVVPMTTVTQRRGVPVEGTSFELVPVQMEWSDGKLTGMDGTKVEDLGFEDGHMLGLLFGDVYLGPGGYGADDLLVIGFAQPDVAIKLRVPAASDVKLAILWRLGDAEYLARELYGACPRAWSLGTAAAIREELPDGAAGWLRLVVPLLNRGVPRDLLVGCRAYTEATPDR